MEMPTSARLLLQGEKTLSVPIRPNLIAYCPTMDMIAVVTEEEDLEVFRLNGQRAFIRRRKSQDSSVQGICWKYNGKFIALAWSDFTVELISSENGKIVPQTQEESRIRIDQTEQEAPHLSCLASQLNFINVPQTRHSNIPIAYKLFESSNIDKETTTEGWDTVDDEVSLNDILQGQNDLQKLDNVPDLPAQLASMDVERLLPRLPVLPPAPAGPLGRPIQSTPDVFTSQTSIDAMFHSQHLEVPNSVETRLLCFSNGQIFPIMYDSMEVTPSRLPQGWIFKPDAKVLHSSHQRSRTHCFLADIVCQATADNSIFPTPARDRKLAKEGYKLALVPLTFRFMAMAGSQIHLVGSKQRQLEHLLRYVQEAFRSISGYWYHSQDLPSRLMRNINETLSEKGEGDLGQNLFHLAVTGHCPPSVKEWLVDELTESGHKRWDLTAGQGYNKVVELLHENFLPALDRCSVIVTLLRGHAQYDESSSMFDVPIKDFTFILEVIKRIRLLGHNLLLHVAEERSQFDVFSKWLQHEIEVQRSTSSSNDDITNRDLGTNYGQLLKYIQGGLNASHAIHFLRRNPTITDNAIPKDNLPAYDKIKTALDGLKGKTTAAEDNLDIWAFLQLLRMSCQDMFRQMAKWRATNTNINSGLVLEEEDTLSARDIRTLKENTSEERDLVTYVVSVPASRQNELRLHRIIHNYVLDDVSKAISSSQTCTIILPEGSIKDVKFASDESMLTLLQTKSASYLITIPYSDIEAPSAMMPWRSRTTPSGDRYESVPAMALPHGHAGGARHTWDLSDPESVHQYIQHVFPIEERFVPRRLDPNGREHRRVVCVLSEDLKHYKVLDMDYPEEDDAMSGVEEVTSTKER